MCFFFISGAKRNVKPKTQDDKNDIKIGRKGLRAMEINTLEHDVPLAKKWEQLQSMPQHTNQVDTVTGMKNKR